MAEKTRDGVDTPTCGGIARASDAIVAELRHAIITSELPPGAVVTEAYLMGLLSCSRTPLREALQRLAQERLIVSVPRRGVSVSDFSLEESIELLEALDGLDAYSARLAAERISEAQLAELAEIMAAAEEAKADHDISRVAELDFSFHQAVGKASGNRFLSEIEDTLHRLSTRLVFRGLKRTDSSLSLVANHQRLLDGLASHDADVAETMAHEHLEAGRERIKAAF